MINVREVIRRLIKYLSLILVVGFGAVAIPKNKIENMEVFWIAIIAGIMFSILDSVTPSIKIHVEKN
jgi:hypothetical protein